MLSFTTNEKRRVRGKSLVSQLIIFRGWCLSSVEERARRYEIKKEDSLMGCLYWSIREREARELGEKVVEVCFDDGLEMNIVQRSGLSWPGLGSHTHADTHGEAAQGGASGWW